MQSSNNYIEERRSYFESRIESFYKNQYIYFVLVRNQSQAFSLQFYNDIFIHIHVLFIA